MPGLELFFRGAGFRLYSVGSFVLASRVPNPNVQKNLSALTHVPHFSGFAISEGNVASLRGPAQRRSRRSPCPNRVSLPTSFSSSLLATAAEKPWLDRSFITFATPLACIRVNAETNAFSERSQHSNRSALNNPFRSC